jgi:hypothetical protein
MTPTDLAHEAVLRRSRGEHVTPDTITADLLADGATHAQAVTTTKMVVALIPTVTAESLRAYVAQR